MKNQFLRRSAPSGMSIVCVDEKNNPESFLFSNYSKVVALQLQQQSQQVSKQVFNEVFISVFGLFSKLR